MKYTIYRVTNKINGKVYIGSHKTKNLDDNYMGSGKYLNYSISKHGIENFEKEILHVFDTPEEMYAKEAEIVTEDFIAESNTYNLKVGGFGGFDYINDNGLAVQHITTGNSAQLSKKARKKFSSLMRNPEYKKTYSKKMSKTWKTKFENGFTNGFADKTHTKETKAKIGAANAIHQKGKKNSQYGTCWIHNNRVSKKIEKDDLNEYLTEGWIKGRKIKF